ncbi:hypothetical protein [Rubellicoccus peritrichatus]|uniref:Uncharacterized protein n=1 Tax=Rubellicoccus peritrichatus TaxID=3080537 RepID=A0AAQ3LCR1_9BACT|nr:hypothetical protein [Puniceicoccus sp. CR14]WOO43649.1 hypothetical protein RZN69_11165 [Puniceicoccus sp. CR14]
MDADHTAPETSHSNYYLSFVGAVGSLLLFLFIIFIAYLPNRPGSVNEDIVENRLNNLATVRAAQKDVATEYAWVNEKEGVVRIPVSQAMKLTAERLGKGEPAFAPAKPKAEAATTE